MTDCLSLKAYSIQKPKSQSLKQQSLSDTHHCFVCTTTQINTKIAKPLYYIHLSIFPVTVHNSSSRSFLNAVYCTTCWLYEHISMISSRCPLSLHNDQTQGWHSTLQVPITHKNITIPHQKFVLFAYAWNCVTPHASCKH